MAGERQSEGALAVIARDLDGDRQYLTRWNRHWQSFALVGGHRQPDETFRECLLREVTEELGLDEDTGFVASAAPLVRLDFRAWSARAHADTRYTLEIFRVELLDARARQAVEQLPAVRWVSTAEIEAHRCRDDAPVSETVSRVLHGVAAAARPSP